MICRMPRCAEISEYFAIDDYPNYGHVCAAHFTALPGDKQEHYQRDDTAFIVASVKKVLSEENVWLWKALSRDINRTAYHGGLGLIESGKYLALVDQLLAIVGEKV